MGAALGCASSNNATAQTSGGGGGGNNGAVNKSSSHTNSNDGKGKGGDGERKKSISDEPPQEELQGKNRYLGEVGAVVHTIEEKKLPIGQFIVFVSPKGETCFSALITAKDKVFVARYADDAFQAKRDESNITMTFNAIFKSIVTDTAKGKVKIDVSDANVTVTFTITSIKDAKSTQPLKIVMEPTTEPKVKAKNMHILEPFARHVGKRRLSTEEAAREKEKKANAVQLQSVLSAALVAKGRTTIERVQKSILPLRKHAAEQSKATSELQSKVEQTERRIRKLRSNGDETSVHNLLDGLYQHGGARYFQHLPDAEEHIPSLPTINDNIMDVVLSKLPVKEGQTLEAALQATPTDPAIANIKDPMVTNSLKILEKLDTWEMSMFEAEQATGGNALYTVTMAMLAKLDLISHFKLDKKVLKNFLMNVQAGYHPNPYHNKTHATDVAQINYFIMTQGGLVEKCKLSKVDILAGVLAGTIHDYDHPGFNNNFHTKTNAYLATLYNDRSVLENHHLACIFEMMRLPQYDIFRELPDEQKRTIRDTMIEMVLATDMGNHAKIFGQFRRRLGEGQDWHEKREDVLLALSMSIKMADVSNCGRPKMLYLEWAKNIATEFYMQGDAEERRNMPISPFMDRKKEKTDFPKGQISFMNYVVVPMFEAIAELLPPVEVSLQFCAENKEYWQHLE